MGEGRRSEGGVGLRSEFISASVLVLARAKAMGFETGTGFDLSERLDELLGVIRKSNVVSVDLGDLRLALGDPILDPVKVSEQLHQLFKALEEARAPQQEGNELLRVFSVGQLAELICVSPTSLRRYIRGERRAPIAVVDRLHWLALVVGYLYRAYNQHGVRRWFRRPHAALDGVSPMQALLATTGWTPDSESACMVESMARALTVTLVS